MKVTIIGAGKTGRGFLARLVKEGGAKISFIDKDDELVKSLNEAGKYRIRFFSDREDMEVSLYTASTWENADISDSDFILVSVGGGNLEDVGHSLRGLMTKDRVYTVITAENSSDPAKKLSEAIGLDNARVSESTVFCTTTDSGLDISSENYPYLQCNADLLGGFDPGVPGIRPIAGFGDFLKRKLYTYNAASCVIAYIGYVKGYSDYADAANDMEILTLLDKNYEVTDKVLCEVFGYSWADQVEFSMLSREKFTSRAIKDTVARNGRDPLRKLASGERIMGPMRLIYSCGKNPDVLIKTAACALLYKGEGEDKWEEAKKKLGIPGIMSSVMGLSPDEDLYKRILAEYERIKKYGL